jgi:hypothetical protein
VSAGSGGSTGGGSTGSGGLVQPDPPYYGSDDPNIGYVGQNVNGKDIWYNSSVGGYVDQQGDPVESTGFEF